MKQNELKSNKIFVITTIPNALNFFRGQINELSRHFDVTLVSSPDSELIQIAQREGVKYNSIPMRRDISLLDDFISLIEFLKFFRKERPTVIHCNTPKASMLGLLAGYITKIPTRIYYIHGLRYEGVTGKKQKLLIAIEKLSCFCATDIIAVSFGVKQKVEKELTHKVVSVIHNGSPNGVLLEEFENCQYDVTQIRQEYGINNSDFVFGFVGRIVKDKGINELVQAFNMLDQKNTKLLLVGSYERDLDPLDEKTLDIIKTNNNIITVGYQKDVKKFLSIMDLYVSPSYREGFGLAVLEANFMKKPVLVSKIMGHSEIVTEGKNGFFVEPKNIKLLYERMKKLMNDTEELKQMSENCYAEVSCKYNHEDVLKSAIAYYSKFI